MFSVCVRRFSLDSPRVPTTAQNTFRLYLLYRYKCECCHIYSIYSISSACIEWLHGGRRVQILPYRKITGTDLSVFMEFAHNHIDLVFI